MRLASACQVSELMLFVHSVLARTFVRVAAVIPQSRWGGQEAGWIIEIPFWKPTPFYGVEGKNAARRPDEVGHTYLLVRVQWNGCLLHLFRYIDNGIVFQGFWRKSFRQVKALACEPLYISLSLDLV